MVTNMVRMREILLKVHVRVMDFPDNFDLSYFHQTLTKRCGFGPIRF